MRATTRRSLRWLAAGAIGVALLTGPAVAESITLRVPVKLKKMLPEAKTARLRCHLEGANLALFSEPRSIVNGELDQVVEMVFTAKAGESFAKATSYFCALLINHPSSQATTPRVGTPPPAQPYTLHLLARPDEYFKEKISGPLDGGKFVPGIAGPKDLTIGPKQKQ